MSQSLKDAWQKPESLEAIFLGGIMEKGHSIPDAPAFLVLKSLNRHGLIAGATGTGKTKTIQVLAEALSRHGVPSLVMDIKGDISGLAMAGDTNPKLIARAQSLQVDYEPQAMPVELMSLDNPDEGLPLRATVGDFGALLLSRMLELSDAQSGVMVILFEFAKQEQLELIGLKDLQSLLQYAQSDAGQSRISQQFGAISKASLGTIMRKVIGLSANGGAGFFGEPAFSVHDFVRFKDERGVISVLRLMDMQEQPQLFSTFMLKLLTDVYTQFDELGDPLKPKLVIFIDEAHLIFKQANKALLQLLDTTVKLIRSKGVGLIFCTQTPDDIPEAILGQLGLKIQHALRAFTAKDRKALKLVAQNFPASANYDTETLLTSLGIGEALVTALDAKGQPCPLIQCMIRPPETRMGILTDMEVKELILKSNLYPHYAKAIDMISAEEKLKTMQQEHGVENKPKARNSTKEPPGMLEQVSKNTLFRQLARQFFKQVTQFLLSIFKGGTKR